MKKLISEEKERGMEEEPELLVKGESHFHSDYTTLHRYQILMYWYVFMLRFFERSVD